MSYQTGTSTDLEDFCSKLSSFAQAEGWTEDEFVSGNQGHMTLHHSSLGTYVSFYWDLDGSIGNGGIGQLGLVHSTGHTAGKAWNDEQPGAVHTVTGSSMVNWDDLDEHQCLNEMGAGPYTAHHFFSGSTYIHAVIEYAPGEFRHLSFGIVNKFGSWAGGEFLAGTYWSQSNTTVDNPQDNAHSVLFDGQSSNTNRAATMRLEGLPNQPGSSKWGLVKDPEFGFTTTDVDGEDMMLLGGDIRSGPYGGHFGFFPTSPSQGFVPLLPIPVWYVDETVSPENIYYLGEMPGVRTVNIANFSPGEEITLGSDTFKIFPWVRKSENDNTDTDESDHGGLAYLKA